MIQISSGEQSTLRLTHALLLYKGGDGNGSVEYSSLHPIEESKRGAVIGAGHPTSKAALAGILKDLSPKKNTLFDIIPSGMISSGPHHLVWYCKPQTRQVWFRNDRLGGEVSAPVPHPGTVFVLFRDDWYVFAVKSQYRPDEEDELYIAPYFNVWEGGKICTGNVTLPKGKQRWNTVAWEEAFYRSFFTHINGHEKTGIVSFSGGAFAFWKKMLNGKYKTFPERHLVPTGATLSKTLTAIFKEGGSK